MRIINRSNLDMVTILDFIKQYIQYSKDDLDDTQYYGKINTVWFINNSSNKRYRCDIKINKSYILYVFSQEGDK